MLEIAQIFGVHKLSSVVSGGKTRQQSVFQGIKAAGAATHFAIHDGARALITPEVFREPYRTVFVLALPPWEYR